MNLYEKLVEIRKSIGGFDKDKTGFGYDYVSGNQVLGKIKDKMNELKVILSPSCVTQNHETFSYMNSKKEEKIDFVVWGEMSYNWIDAESEDKLTETWVYYGQQDDISKAFGSALTYSERYYLLKFFGLPTDADDPDSKDTRGKKSKADDYTMPFGKYKGKRLSEIKDDEYLQWVVSDTQDTATRAKITEYLIANGTINNGFNQTLKGVNK